MIGQEGSSVVLRFRPPARLEPKAAEGRAGECLLH